jgi:hypothetical protein
VRGVRYNQQKVILDLCGGTGAWSEPYRNAGYDVRLITLPTGNVLTYSPPENVYGILAAPPCTEFSLAKNYGRDLREGLETVQACLNIIWEARLTSEVFRFWALENPVGFLRQFLGAPVLTFDPLDYGDPWTKRTDLWGWFKQPKRKPVKADPKMVRRAHSSGVHSLPAGYTVPAGKRHPAKEAQAARRAMTPAGFAKAFKLANP